MKLKIFFTGTLCAAFSLMSHEKSFGQLIDLIAPPPESAALINQINVPVNHFTGNSPLHINLHTVRVGHLQVPITLTYQGSGIKVEDMPSRVGLGWRMSAGGRVTRVIRGLPDEHGYCGPASHGATFNNHKRVNNWSTAIFDDLCSGSGRKDGEPDLFYYEIPGRSGTFIFDETGKAHTLPYEPLKIEWVNKSPNNGTNSYFVITDENGMKYFFQAQEHTGSQQSMAYGTYHVTSWCLTSMMMTDATLPSSEATKIEFKYQNQYVHNYQTRNSSLTRNVTGVQNGVATWESLSSKDLGSDYWVREQVLEEISWEGGSIRFSPYGDFGSQRFVTGGMQIFSMGKPLKGYKFSYQHPESTRFHLIQVDELSGDGSEVYPLYFFRYNQNVSLPKRDGTGTDHWGYYNGDPGTNGIYPECVIEGALIPGANKNPVFRYTTANILTEIVYADGSKKTFEYEPNQTQAGIWGGVRIKQISDYEGNTLKGVTRYEYTHLDGTSSGETYTDEINYVTSYVNNRRAYPYKFTIYYKSLNQLYDLTGSSIVYNRVKEILPNNAYNIYRYTSFNQYADQEAEIINLNSWSEATPVQSCPVTSNAHNRGILYQTESYSASGELIMSRMDNYYLGDTPIKKEIWGYHMRVEDDHPASNTEKKRFLAIYKWNIQPVYLRRIITAKGPHNVASTVEYVYDTTYLTPKEIRLTDAEGSVYTTRMTYPYDFTLPNEANDNTQVAAYKSMIANNHITKPVETIYLKNGDVVGAELYKYRYGRYESEAASLLDSKYTLSLTNPIAESLFTRAGLSDNFLTYDTRYRLDVQYKTYDKRNNVISALGSDGIHRMMYYGYGGGLMIGSAEEPDVNPQPKSFYVNSFEEDGQELANAKTGMRAYYGVYTLPSNLGIPVQQGPYRVSYWLSVNNGTTWVYHEDIYETLTVNTFGQTGVWIDELRIAPARARVTTYTYLPGVGMLSQMDPNGKVVYYTYDSMGRLKEIRDNDRRLVESYEYQ